MRLKEMQERGKLPSPWKGACQRILEAVGKVAWQLWRGPEREVGLWILLQATLQGQLFPRYHPTDLSAPSPLLMQPSHPRLKTFPRPAVLLCPHLHQPPDQHRPLMPPIDCHLPKHPPFAHPYPQLAPPLKHLHRHFRSTFPKV